MSIYDVLVVVVVSPFIVWLFALVFNRARRSRRQARLNTEVAGTAGLAHLMYWSDEHVKQRATYDEVLRVQALRAELRAVHKTVGSQRQRSIDSRP